MSELQLPVYLDYAASTPIDPRVAEKMLPWLIAQDHCGNPSSAHALGRKAHSAIEHARQQVAALLNAQSEEIIFTSGATEANNLALLGIARHPANKGRHIITSLLEHEAVLAPCKQLEREGFTVTYLDLTTPEKLTAALRDDTFLVSIMHVNNEIGVIQDIAMIGNLLREKNILFHVDAAQSVGKLPIDVQQQNIDLLSISAHKIYGPKGIGALYRRTSIYLQPLQYGGGQENNLRSGTLATHQIVGMGEALAVAQQEMHRDNIHNQHLSQRLWTGLNKLDKVYRNGDAEASVPNILNIAFAGIENSKLVPALRDLIIATGSACHSASREPSRVLKAIGLDNSLADSSIRFSLGRFTTAAEIDFAIEKVSAAVTLLR